MKKLYIPFATILKEFKKSEAGSYEHVYICHRSNTFSDLWERNSTGIRNAAKKFLKETGEDVSLLKLHSLGNCLFYSDSLSKNNALKINFILWGREKNKLSRKKRLQKI